jgi:hypothetical protein
MSSDLKQLGFLNWKLEADESKRSPQNALDRTNWDELCAVASRINKDLPCCPLDKITHGMNNLDRLLRFGDQTFWVARISLNDSLENSTKLRSEIDTMQYIKDQSQLPIPQVFTYKVDREDNTAGVPYILMEFIPGNTAMDSGGGFNAHRGRVPDALRPNFYRSVAKCHVSS